MSDPAPLALPEIFDITTVSEVKSQLSLALAAGQPVGLGGGSVHRTDAAALQLLWAFFLEAERRGVSTAWSGASDALREAARLTAMTKALGLDAGATDGGAR